MTNRKKASDVFREANFVFSKKVPFQEAFPTIEELKVKVEESGDGVSEWGRTRHYHTTVGEYVNCSNPLCYNGGFSIGQILRDMVEKEDTQREESKFCQGYEGSPKGRRKYRSCTNSFRIQIQAKCKQF